MAKARDILYGDDGDLQTENGDFVVGYSDNQHIEDILNAAPGHFRQYPLVGANIMQLVNGVWSQQMARGIQIALEADGFKVNTINYDNNILNIEAERK